MGDGLKRAFAAAAISRIHDADAKAAAIWARSKLGDTVLRKTLSIKQLAELLAEYRNLGAK